MGCLTHRRTSAPSHRNSFLRIASLLALLVGNGGCTAEATDPDDSPGGRGTTGESMMDATSGGGAGSVEEGTRPEDPCHNGELDADETDLDCGGSCAPCSMGATCQDDEDCLSESCVSGSCLGSLPGCRLADVQRAPGGSSWADSYSVDGQCYCASTFDHSVGELSVQTPSGTMTVKQICEALGPGPGADGHPLYNDIQCGNGPPNDAGDEDWCPGRVDQGEEGCCTVGPRWDLDSL